MKLLSFSLSVLALLLPAAVAAAEAAYPPPPPPGQPITVEDTVYGVLRTHRSLRGMLENRQVLEHEVDRPKPVSVRAWTSPAGPAAAS